MKKYFVTLLFVLISQITIAQSGWVLQSSNTFSSLRDVQFIGNLTGYAMGGSNITAKILKTTNGGLIWDSIPNILTTSIGKIQFFNATTGYATGYATFFTTNGGISWQNRGAWGSWTYTSFANSTNGWSASDPSIYYTSNSGINWSSQFYNTSINITNIFAYPNTGTAYAVGYYNGTANILSITNTSGTWGVKDNSVNGIFYSIHSPNYYQVCAVGSSGIVRMSTNAGVNWASQISGTTNNLRDVKFTDTARGWAVGDNGTIIKTTNGGLNWVQQYSNVTKNLRSIYLYNSLTGWIVGDSGVILKTTNGGILFSPPAPNLVAPLNNATNQPPTVLLDWDSLTVATSYRIQLATDSLFNSITYDTSGVTRSYVQMRPGILLANVKYYWRVNATNLAGTGTWSVVWNFRINPTGISQYSSEIPKEFKLHNNYPNPFNPSTKIRFDIPKKSIVKISIYDISGRLINQLLNEKLNAGSYELTWNANNYASGVYFYRIETENFTDTKRMLLVK